MMMTLDQLSSLAVVLDPLLELSATTLAALVALVMALVLVAAHAVAGAIVRLLDPDDGAAAAAAHDAEFDPFDHHGDLGGGPGL